MTGTSNGDGVTWIRPGGDGVSWSRHSSGSLVNPDGERKASHSGSHPYGNCVVVRAVQVNPRA